MHYKKFKPNRLITCENLRVETLSAIQFKYIIIMYEIQPVTLLTMK